MAKLKTTRPPIARRQPRKRGGGPTAAGGYNYQAAVTAIALAYAGRGAPLGWLDGLADDTPREVACETGRGGDDIRLTLVNGDRVEIQVKKGLSAGAALTDALTDLATVLADGSAAFGVLAVCPFSSRTVAQGLAADIIRLGQDPSAEIDPLAADFRDSLTAGGLDIAGVCGRLRIVTVAALDGNAAHVAAARAELAYLCGNPAQARSAWDALYRFASIMIASRGRRTVAGIVALLRSAGIDLSKGEVHATAVLIDRLIRWTADTNDSFSILGLGQNLSIDEAWLPLTLRVTTETIPATTDTQTALDAYHGWSARPGAKGETCDADSVGRFFRQAVKPGDLALTDPFFLMADDQVTSGGPFGEAHPHAGLETVTFMLNGFMEDGTGRLEEGDVEWMTAGSGIVHNKDTVVSTGMRLFQLWLILPERDRNMEPRVQILKRDQMPVRRAHYEAVVCSRQILRWLDASSRGERRKPAATDGGPIGWPHHALRGPAPGYPSGRARPLHRRIGARVGRLLPELSTRGIPAGRIFARIGPLHGRSTITGRHLSARKSGLRRPLRSASASPRRACSRWPTRRLAIDWRRRDAGRPSTTSTALGSGIATLCSHKAHYRDAGESG
nr:pirin family protein [Brevundimonas naejangsanensis]